MMRGQHQITTYMLLSGAISYVSTTPERWSMGIRLVGLATPLAPLLDAAVANSAGIGVRSLRSAHFRGGKTCA